MIERHPGFIARCADVADVMAAVNFARESDLLAAVRGGGHNGPGFGTCDDGLVIDLSTINYTEVSPGKYRTVWGGCRWADVDHASHAFGLATPSGTPTPAVGAGVGFTFGSNGVVSTSGVGGLTLGGGYGYLTRK